MHADRHDSHLDYAQLIVEATRLHSSKWGPLKEYWAFFVDSSQPPSGRAAIALSTEPSFPSLVEKFWSISDDQQRDAVTFITSLAAENVSPMWWSGMKLTQPQLAIVLLQQMAPSGESIELTQLVDALKSAGASVSNRSWLQTEGQKKGWIAVVKLGVGSQSSEIALTPEGNAEVERLKALSEFSTGKMQ